MTMTPMQLTRFDALHPEARRVQPAERFTAVGGTLVVASTDGRIRFGDRPTDAHLGPVSALGTHDGLVLSAGRDGFVALWDPSGRPLFARHHPTGPIAAATLVDGTIVVADDHGFVFATDLHTGESDWIADVRDRITSIAALGEVVVVGTESGTVHFDGITEKRHRGAVVGLYPLSPYETLSIGRDGRVRLGDDLLLRVAEGVTASAYHNGRLVLSIGRELQEWDLRTLELKRQTTSVAGGVVDLGIDPGGVLALVEGESTPRRWL